MSKLKVFALKNRARRHWTAHKDIADRYDCGLTLAGVINPDLARHAREFNAAMDELAKLDPAAPAHRLPTE